MFNQKDATMNVEIIGTWAGLVWEALNASGMLTMKGLKKATKLKNEDLYMALGWLAREGKLAFVVNEKEITIELV